MELNAFQIILICLGAVIVADFIRLLSLKLLSKRFRLFAIVPDTEQSRLEFISKQLGVDTTDIVLQEDTYFDINDTKTEYKLTCVPSYVLTNISGEEQAPKPEVVLEKDFSNPVDSLEVKANLSEEVDLVKEEEPKSLSFSEEVDESNTLDVVEESESVISEEDSLDESLEETLEESEEEEEETEEAPLPEPTKPVAKKIRKKIVQ